MPPIFRWVVHASSAQQVRSTRLVSGRTGFESREGLTTHPRRSSHAAAGAPAPVAQRERQRAQNAFSPGSNPGGGTHDPGWCSRQHSGLWIRTPRFESWTGSPPSTTPRGTRRCADDPCKIVVEGSTPSSSTTTVPAHAGAGRDRPAHVTTVVRRPAKPSTPGSTPGWVSSPSCSAVEERAAWAPSAGFGCRARRGSAPPHRLKPCRRGGVLPKARKPDRTTGRIPPNRGSTRPPGPTLKPDAAAECSLSTRGTL